MSNKEQLHQRVKPSEFDWRKTDFSGIRETYKGRKRSKNPAHTALYWMCFFLGSIFLPFFHVAYRGEISFTGFLTIVGLLASFLLFVKFKRSRRLPKYLLNDRVYGTIGDLSSASGKFSAGNIAAGEAGEKKTAKLLNELLLIPGTRIFHGALWPGSMNADIDHIVVNGNKIALVDSKMWAGESHTLMADGHVESVLTDGRVVERSVSFANAVQGMRDVLPDGNFQCLGFLAIHSHEDAVYAMDENYDNYLLVEANSAKNVVTRLGHWFADDVTGQVDVKLMNFIHASLK